MSAAAAAVLLPALAAGAWSRAPPPPPAPPAAAAGVLRYDLLPGDHLVYHQWLERRVRSARAESRSESEWESHLLVVDRGAGFVQVGFQRNRTRAELLRYTENGADRLARGRRELAETLARRGVSFAETNWLRPDGVALLPWSAVREAASERLPLFHELEPLPPEPVAAGTAFTSPGLLRLPMRALGTELVAGEPCLRLEGEAAGTAVRQWHCQGTGTLGRLEYEARYGAPGGGEVVERLRLERVSFARGQPAAGWLDDPATARGLLSALAASQRLALPPAALYRALPAAPAEVQRLLLAVAWRHRLAPPLEALRPLSASDSARVRALAVRLLGQRPEPEARAQCERAASDPDAAVRAASRREPAPPAEWLRLARAVRGDGALPAWAGPLEDGIGRTLLRAQRAAGQVAGSTLRFMADPRFRGRPYVLHVPDEYRGDEPFPLLFVLGGGPGRAVPTAQLAHPEIDPRGTLAVFPQANGMWWEDEPGAAFEALLQELLLELDVDTDRVTVAGSSNGGTGALLFASRLPERFAGYASLMGGGLPFFEETAPLDPGALARLPALFVHGARDETIPSWASERTVQALRRAHPGGVAELRLLEARPHDVFIGRDQDLTLPFLERQLRQAFPRQVVLRARRPAHARAFWVEVLQKAGRAARVDADADGQRLVLRTRNVRRLRLCLRRELLDLSRPVEVQLNGRAAWAGPVAEDPALFLRRWRDTRDPQLACAAALELDVDQP